MSWSPPGHPVEQLWFLWLPAVGGRGALWGQNWKALLAKSSVRLRVKFLALSTPTACGNLLVETSWHYLLASFYRKVFTEVSENPDPKKCVPQSLQLFRMPCFIYMPCCKSVVTLKAQVANQNYLTH